MKRASLLQKLFKAARLLNDQAIERARSAAGLPNLRAAHTSLFPHIDLAGSRITEIAERLGISKQAVAQLVDELVEMSVLEKVPDPTDGRAKLVRFSRAKGRSLFDGLTSLMTLEEELAREVGSDRLSAFGDTLDRILSWVESVESDR